MSVFKLRIYDDLLDWWVQSEGTLLLEDTQVTESKRFFGFQCKYKTNYCDSQYIPAGIISKTSILPEKQVWPDPATRYS